MESLTSHSSESQTRSEEPWQLQMFRRSLKKQQKLHLLLGILGNISGQRCMLMTCGDNNGALNWYFKRHGGNWTWVDAEDSSVKQIGELTGDPVTHINKDEPILPFSDDYFDVVLTIDVHEHLKNPAQVNQELCRVTKPGKRVIVSTPNGDERKLAVRIKNLLGMKPAEYGHMVIGYDIPDLEEQLKQVGLQPYGRGSYSHFFTEMLELMINFAYVKVLSKRSRAKVEQGQIAPQTEDQLSSVKKSYKLYSMVYPVFWALSKLDYLVRFTRGYAVVVEARKV